MRVNKEKSAPNSAVVCKHCNGIAASHAAANFLEAFDALHSFVDGPCPRCGNSDPLYLVLDTSLTAGTKQLQHEITHLDASRSHRPASPSADAIARSRSALKREQTRYPLPSINLQSAQAFARRYPLHYTVADVAYAVQRGSLLQDEIDGILEEIARRAPQHQRDTIAAIPIGVVDYPIVNAIGRQVPKSDVPIILLDYMLLRYIYDFSRIVLASMAIRVVEPRAEAFQNRSGVSIPAEITEPNAVQLLRTLTACYINRREPRLTDISGEKLPLVLRTTRAAKMFLVAHELGHIVCAHTPQHRGPDQESEADHWAISILQSRDRSLQGADLEESFPTLGPLFVLAMQHTVEGGFRRHRRNPRALFGLFSMFPSDLGTHPTARDRWAAIRARFAQTKMRAALEIAERAFALVEQALA